MILNNQIALLLQDPIVYYEYYYKHYKDTKTLYDKMIQIGANQDQLIDIRIELAENVGKYSIARGALMKLPEYQLIEYWKEMNSRKKNIGSDLSRLQAFEDFVMMVSEICRKK